MRVVFGNESAVGKVDNPAYDEAAHAAALEAGQEYVDEQGRAIERQLIEDHSHLGRTFTIAAYPTDDPMQVLAMLHGSGGKGGQLESHFADKPAWVESDNEQLAAFLGTALGIPVGRPDDWDIETPTPFDIPDRKPAYEPPAITETQELQG